MKESDDPLRSQKQVWKATLSIFSQRNKKAINSELNLFKISVFAIIKEPEAEDRSIHFIQGDTH